MPRIAIVGAGVAGLHLGLFLRQHGVEVTLYSDRAPDAIRNGRLPNTVALSSATRARERGLGVAHWEAPEWDTVGVHLHIQGEPPLAFRGKFGQSVHFIDMRLYLARLLEDFEAHGGRVVVSGLDRAGVSRTAADHELVVIATGRAGLADMFPRVDERSPFTEPQRSLFAGLFRGIRMPEDRHFRFQTAPGQGEVFEHQILTFEGKVPGLLIEGKPGGDIDRVLRMRQGDDPARFVGSLYEMLQEYAPLTRPRMDRDSFDVLRPLDTLQGAITPVARRGYVMLDGGTCAVALGDAHVTHDPVAGQGANAASHAAWVLGELLVARVQQGQALDQAFCAHAEQRLWDAVQPAFAISNALLLPPPPHVIGVFVAAARNPAVADGFADSFTRPDRMWACLGSPEGAQRFLAGFA